MNLPTSDALIGRIYDTLLDPGDWTQLLESLADWSGADAQASQSDAGFQEEAGKLIGHLERAVRGNAYLHMVEDQNQLLGSLYQNMPWPMLMLAQDLSVVSCNPVARKVLNGASPLQLLPEGRLSFQDGQLQQDLRKVISMAGGRHPQILTSTMAALTLLCVPFGKSDAQGDISRIRTIVWVLASQHVVVPSPESLRSVFRLSNAESRLLHLLCKVGNLNQCAGLLSVSTHTVRAQLKSAMAKVGVNSQVQLVSQAMGHGVLQATEPSPDQAAENTMTLPDGRILSWYEYGHPRGRPVLALENIGSSIPDHALHDLWYRQHKLRVIVVVRPGYGLSTARPNFQFRDLAPDLRALCQQLRIERPIMASYCCGGSYALCAAALDPELFERIGLLASTVPIEHFELHKLDRLHRMFLQLFRRDPRLFVLIGRLALRGVQRSPEKYFRYLAKGLKDRDHELLTDPEILQQIIRQQRLRHFQGSRMVIEEYLNLQRPWGVDLAQIRVPTLIWHGEDDAIISIGSARSMAACIPGAAFRALPGHGRFMVFDVWREFIAELLGLADGTLRKDTRPALAAARP
jgi:pimeloyl-ACP methyl ester carboxylesterase/DNA-binding CsgD family transcriptional regulator